LIFGGASGLLFAALVTRTDLQHFFYIRGDKFLIPRYSYWFAFSLLQLMALGGAYLICIARHWLKATLKRRDIAAALTIGLDHASFAFADTVNEFQHWTRVGFFCCSDSFLAASLRRFMYVLW
jgi:hypothetical protein